MRGDLPTFPEVPVPSHAPGIPGVRLPSRPSDSMELQPDEEVVGWMGRCFTSLDARTRRLERGLRRVSRVHVGSAVLQTLVWAALTVYAISRGAQPPAFPGVPPAAAATQETPP